MGVLVPGGDEVKDEQDGEYRLGKREDDADEQPEVRRAIDACTRR